FYGIDTPESTGEVDKWGVSASLFTKAQINANSEFVLESSTGGAAEKDSYGTRYLGYVWYRNSSSEDWKNLNLLIVENGYSKSTIQNSPQYEYYPFFKKAETFAKDSELHIWSEDEDPNYSDKALSANLKQLNE
ncbi:MAG: thermonuclease family protein, partial [Acholeplasmatales bacterium]|nr:thermonuclease family protein [Acholeplasmatales bacterium]